MPLKALIADDHPIVSTGIVAVLAPLGIEVVATVDSPEKILTGIDLHQPDVLILEARLGGSDALKVLESLPETFPTNRVVVFSGFSHPSHVARASAFGCHDFIPKSAGVAALATAVQGAIAGEATPSSSLLTSTKAKMRRPNNSDHSNHPLTNREIQVLRHVSMGLSNREVGKALGISVETVKEHVQNILRKLNVNDRTQAAVWAVRGGFV